MPPQKRKILKIPHPYFVFTPPKYKFFSIEKTLSSENLHFVLDSKNFEPDFFSFFFFFLKTERPRDGGASPGRSFLEKVWNKKANSSQNVPSSSVCFSFFLSHDGKRHWTQNWPHNNALSERRSTIISRLWMCTTKIICHTPTVHKYSNARISQTKPNRK